ncbi:DUF3466 family protein [Parasalinivibrio latis]|uniref:DUF3466 family protein n=1 Tax=Parasalinivibrio latis TaxID=2952610 RepID=UPI0030E4452D
MHYPKLKKSALMVGMALMGAYANTAMASAFYQVQEISVADATSIEGAAIQQKSEGSCYTADSGDTCDARSYSAGANATNGSVGAPFYQEQPFLDYFEEETYYNNYDDFEDYCAVFLGYTSSLCESWANTRWYGKDNQGGQKALYDASNNKSYDPSSIAYVNSVVQNPASGWVNNTGGTKQPSTADVVVNSIDLDGNIVGDSSSLFFEKNGIWTHESTRRGFINNTQLLPPLQTALNGTSNLISLVGQTSAKDIVSYTNKTTSTKYTFVVGSATFALGNMNSESPFGGNFDACDNVSDDSIYSNKSCQYSPLANQAAFWLDPATDKKARLVDGAAPTPVVEEFNTGQGSLQSVALNTDNQPLMVGYKTKQIGDYLYPEAVAYLPTSADISTCITAPAGSTYNCWTQKAFPVSLAAGNSDRYYSYTVANDVNKDGFAVVNAKRATLENGAYPVRMFLWNTGTNAYSDISSTVNSLTFPTAGGSANAINDDKTVVGKVDFESARERQRRQRGFVYFDGNKPAAVGSQSAWLLDDLTNDGGLGGNNQFRIISANDINNDGVIAATALKCAGGYESTAVLSPCSGTETTVAVKLIPNSSKTNTISIIARDEGTGIPVKRKGAGIGILVMTMLGLIGFSRRSK